GEETVEVTLTPEAIERAGIRIADVRSGAALSGITVPGTVMSNAYRDTKVNALVGGIVRQVSVELGSLVEVGQPLAVIFSTELAEAQMKYLSMRAMLQADRQKRQRTEKLVELGAASRQELEDITAIHAAHETELAAARQRLLLLGLSDDRVAKLESASGVVSEVTVPSPTTGIVIGRSERGSGPERRHGPFRCHRPQQRLDHRRSLRKGLRPGPRRVERDDQHSGHAGAVAPRPRRLHRPAHRSGNANRQGAGRGPEPRRPAPPWHVRHAE